MQELYIPMERLAILKERKNMLAGLEKSLRCKINVDMHGGIGTGYNTFYGRTARLVENAKPKSHLEAAIWSAVPCPSHTCP